MNIKLPIGAKLLKDSELEKHEGLLALPIQFEEIDTARMMYQIIHGDTKGYHRLARPMTLKEQHNISNKLRF